MTTILFAPTLLNLVLDCLPESLIEQSTITYEKYQLSGNTKPLIAKMKMVHRLVSADSENKVPKKLYTHDARTLWHIIKLLALISGADPENTNSMWFEALERAEENPDMKEGNYLRLCDRIKDMKRFYDFIMPASNRDDFIVEIEEHDDGEWIRVSYFELNI